DLARGDAPVLERFLRLLRPEPALGVGEALAAREQRRLVLAHRSRAPGIDVGPGPDLARRARFGVIELQRLGDPDAAVGQAALEQALERLLGDLRLIAQPLLVALFDHGAVAHAAARTSATSPPAGGRGSVAAGIVPRPAPGIRRDGRRLRRQCRLRANLAYDDASAAAGIARRARAQTNRAARPGRPHAFRSPGV